MILTLPAMLAVRKQTAVPAKKARTTTPVICSFFSGAKEVKQPIMMPIDPGFAKPQIAKVAIVSALPYILPCFLNSPNL